ncbi:molecular chaperone DnaJ [bacterium]|nr:molecular chaperone DnaJ [bacterium]
MAASKVDLYEILGVARDAGPDEIKKAYRKLARQYHPDVSSSPDADERFKEINTAYEVLSDPAKRQQYDQFGTTGSAGLGGDPFGGMGFSSMNDIIDFFFGGGFGGVGAAAHRRDYQPGEDLHRAVHLRLTDVLDDHSVELKLDRREICETCGGSRAEPGSQPENCQTCGGHGAVRQVRDTLLGRMQTTTTCPTCHGTGYTIPTPCKACRGTGFQEKQRTIEITIPAGIDDGNVIRIGNQGHAGRGGAPGGDLLVSISIEPHEQFKRDGAALYVELPVHYADLVQGATVTVPTLTGEEQLRIPAGTSSHHIFQLRGHGLPRLRRGGRGDLHVRVVVAIPSRVNKRQRELLGELKGEDLKASQKAGGILYQLLNRK